MPTIKSSTSLRNDYSKISKYCHETGEPVYVTVNGEGDLTVMSIDGVPMLDFDEAMSELKALAHGKL